MNNAQLRETDRHKEEFLATLAHELRNPLAPISNSLHILRLSGELSPAMERVREIMEQQIHHLTRLVDDLLDVSRMSLSKIKLRKEQVQLSAIVESAVETSRPLIEAAGHQLAIAISPQPMTLDADPIRITQVMVNLLNNAAKYTEEGGQIWLKVRREGDDSVITVRDNGLGITPDMLPRVFDIFTQVDATLNRAQGGLGVGLALARTLVELHGGRIEAHSDGLGSGSEFMVRLPLVLDPIWSMDFPTAPGSSAIPLASRRILVVDDMRDSAYILGTLLTKMGHQVRIAHDAASALDELQMEPADVVFLDIGMPRISGYELARRVRQEPAWEGMVLVAMTGYGQDTDRQQASEAGFDHHLVKPVNLTDLENLLACLSAPSKAADSSGLLERDWQYPAILDNYVDCGPCLLRCSR